MPSRKLKWTIGEGILSGGTGTAIVVSLIDYLQVSYPEQPQQLWTLLSALFGAVIVGGVAGTSKAVRHRNINTKSEMDLFEENEKAKNPSPTNISKP